MVFNPYLNFGGESFVGPWICLGDFNFIAFGMDKLKRWPESLLFSLQEGLGIGTCMLNIHLFTIFYPFSYN
jgi:hypothetical protein